MCVCVYIYVCVYVTGQEYLAELTVNCMFVHGS